MEYLGMLALFVLTHTHVHTHLWLPGLWSVAGHPRSCILHRVWLTVPALLEDTQEAFRNTQPRITVFAVITYSLMKINKKSLPFRQAWIATRGCH